MASEEVTWSSQFNQNGLDVGHRTPGNSWGACSPTHITWLHRRNTVVTSDGLSTPVFAQDAASVLISHLHFLPPPSKYRKKAFSAKSASSECFPPSLIQNSNCFIQGLPEQSKKRRNERAPPVQRHPSHPSQGPAPLSSWVSPSPASPRPKEEGAGGPRAASLWAARRGEACRCAHQGLTLQEEKASRPPDTSMSPSEAGLRSQS